MFRANLVRLYPNKEQEIQLTKTYHGTRFVYNWGLALSKRYYSIYKKSLNQYRLKNQLPKLKRLNPWLKELDSLALQSSITDLNTAYVNFFRTKIGFPKFKSVKTASCSFTAYQTCNLKNNKIKIAKNKPIRQRGLRDEYAEHKIKNITVTKRKDQKWVAALLFDVTDVMDVTTETTETVGIDMGVINFTYDSNGKSTAPVDVTKEYLKIEALQSYQAKQKRRGKNKHKTQIKINRLHQKIKNKKKDQIEKLTHSYKGKRVVTEDLNIKQMTKKGKKSLNKSILQQSWGLFLVRLSDKTEVIKVNPAYTSQQCSRCGFIHKKNRESQADFVCKKCNLKINADYNASINILNRGNHEDCLENCLSTA